MKKYKEGAVYCGKCDKEMKKAVLSSYEYVSGIHLDNVECYKCFYCGNIIFTEEQALELERKTREVEKEVFVLERKLTVSGRCVALNFPKDLVKQLKLFKGQKVKIKPLSGKKILLEVT